MGGWGRQIYAKSNFAFWREIATVYHSLSAFCDGFILYLKSLNFVTNFQWAWDRPYFPKQQTLKLFTVKKEICKDGTGFSQQEAFKFFIRGDPQDRLTTFRTREKIHFNKNKQKRKIGNRNEMKIMCTQKKWRQKEMNKWKKKKTKL